MDIEGLKKLVNDWYSKQGVTAGIEVVVTVNIVACKVNISSDLLMKDFITEEKFEAAGVWLPSTSMPRLRSAIRNNGYDTMSVSDFIKIPNIDVKIEAWNNIGASSKKRFIEVLVFHGFKPST